jgi:hypothetical protein
MDAVITTAASVGWGRLRSSPGASSRISVIAAAPTSPVTCVFEPAGAHRKSLEQPGGDVRDPDPGHLPVPVDRPAGTGSERGGNRDRVGQRYERDTEGAGHEQREVGEPDVRNGEWREALGEYADECHAACRQTEHPCRDDRQNHHDQDPGDPRSHALEHEDQDQSARTDGHGGRHRLATRHSAHERRDLAEEAVGVHRESEDLGELADQDRHGQAVHVADHRGLRDQVRDESELPDSRDHGDHAGHERESRGERDRAAGLAVRPDEGQHSGRDHGTERGVRAQHQDPRGSEQRISEEAENRRVQAGDRGQAGEFRVGHSLRDQKSGQDQACNHILRQPARLVGEQRRQPRNEGGPDPCCHLRPIGG